MNYRWWRIPGDPIWKGRAWQARFLYDDGTAWGLYLSRDGEGTGPANALWDLAQRSLESGEAQRMPADDIQSLKQTLLQRAPATRDDFTDLQVRVLNQIAETVRDNPGVSGKRLRHVLRAQASPDAVTAAARSLCPWLVSERERADGESFEPTLFGLLASAQATEASKLLEATFTVFAQIYDADPDVREFAWATVAEEGAWSIESDRRFADNVYRLAGWDTRAENRDGSWFWTVPLLEIEHLHTIRDLPAYIEYLRANPETHPWPTCPAKLTGDDDHVSVMVARFEETLDASPTDVDPVSPAASTVEALVQRRAELAGIVNPLADIELVRAWVNSVRPLVRYGFPDFLADFERAAEEPTWPSRASTGTTLDRTLLAGQMHAHRLQDTAEGYRRGLLGVVDALLSIVDAVPRAAPAEHLRLLERIGGGAFADVWHGRDNRLDRDVAFKLIRASREIEASVENHARALAKVNHPNVVTVHGVENVIVPDTGLVMRAIVMEFLDGQSLQARIDAGPAFTRAEAKAICTAIIEGVQAIHDVGLAHNDLHPGNIVVARAQTKVIDVLHRDASSLLTTGTMAHRFRTDCRAVRDLVRIVVEHSEMPPQVLAPLDSLGWEASLDAVRAAFGVVFAEAAPAPVTNEGGLPDFRVRVTVAVVGLDTGPAKQLSIEGQNFDSSAVFVSAAGFELADGRRLALTRDAATRAPLVGREVKPGDSMTVMFDPGAVIDELELDQVGAAFFRDKLGRVFRSTADAVQAALSPWRT